MRMRQPLLQVWERENDRPFLYGGEARGALVATWKQAARAELAKAMQVEYGIALLDLVKAFDRIPHAVLLREALRLRFPLWLLRLSVQVYLMPRS